jgi:DNA-binding IclR family transcriptional regulator
MDAVELGPWLPPAQHLHHVAWPVVAGLRRHTRFAVHLVVLDDHDAVFLKTLCGTRHDISPSIPRRKGVAHQ